MALIGIKINQLLNFMKLFVYFPHRHCLITHNVLGTYNCDKWKTKKPPLNFSTVFKNRNFGSQMKR